MQVTLDASSGSTGGAQSIATILLGVPVFRYFNVAIPVPEKAIEATTKHWFKSDAAAKIVDASVVRRLSSEEVAVLGLARRGIEPA